MHPRAEAIANMELTDPCHPRTCKCRTPVTREHETNMTFQWFAVARRDFSELFQWLAVDFLCFSEWARHWLSPAFFEPRVARLWLFLEPGVPRQWLAENVMWLSVARNGSTVAFSGISGFSGCVIWLAAARSGSTYVSENVMSFSVLATAFLVASMSPVSILKSVVRIFFFVVWIFAIDCIPYNSPRMFCAFSCLLDLFDVSDSFFDLLAEVSHLGLLFSVFFLFSMRARKTPVQNMGVGTPEKKNIASL